MLRSGRPAGKAVQPQTDKIAWRTDMRRYSATKQSYLLVVISLTFWNTTMKFWPMKPTDALASQVAELESKLEKAQIRINDLLLEKFRLETELDTARQYHPGSPRNEPADAADTKMQGNAASYEWMTQLAA
jgi:hypothetical protein